MNAIHILRALSLTILFIIPHLTITKQEEPSSSQKAIESVQNGLCQIGLGTATFTSRVVFHLLLAQMFNKTRSNDSDHLKNQSDISKLMFIIPNYICSELLRNKLSRAMEQKSHATTHINDSNIIENEKDEAKTGSESPVRSYMPSLSFIVSSALSCFSLYLYELDYIAND